MSDPAGPSPTQDASHADTPDAGAEAGSGATPGTASRPARPGTSGDREIPWRLIAIGVLAVYGILFVILNSKQVSVSFVFFTTHVSLIVGLVLALLLGFVAGYLFDTARARRKRAGKAAPRQ